MDELQALLNSISEQDKTLLQSVAKNLLASDATPEKAAADPVSAENVAAQTPTSADDTKRSPFSGANFSKTLETLSKELQTENDYTKFLESLKPLLSAQRQKKAEEAIHFLHLMDTLPLLKGLL